MQRLRPITLGTAVVLAAVTAAELFLRLMVPPEVAFGTWYSPGIHRADEQFGFLFQPGYRGVMHHADRVGGVPLRLDARGHRRSAGTGDRDVVLIGGASMVFSYGLPDAQTVHAELARRSPDLTVYNTAWPGFGTLRNWHVFRDRFEPDIDPSIAVVFFYDAVPADFADTPDDFALPAPQPRDRLFRFRSDLVLYHSGRIANLMGPWYYRSYVGHHLAAAADDLLDGLLGDPRDEPGAPSAPASDGAARFVALLRHLDDHFSQRGARMLVAFAPKRRRGADFYEPLAELVPPDIPWIDLHGPLITRLGPDDWIASGHYGPPITREMGRLLAERIEGLPGSGRAD